MDGLKDTSDFIRWFLNKEQMVMPRLVEKLRIFGFSEDEVRQTTQSMILNNAISVNEQMYLQLI